MEFFEGKRVRELRGGFEGALDATLEPPSTQVRRRILRRLPPQPPAADGVQNAVRVQNPN